MLALPSHADFLQGGENGRTTLEQSSPSVPTLWGLTAARRPPPPSPLPPSICVADGPLGPTQENSYQIWVSVSKTTSRVCTNLRHHPPRPGVPLFAPQPRPLFQALYEHPWPLSDSSSSLVCQPHWFSPSPAAPEVLMCVKMSWTPLRVCLCLS